MNFIDVLKKARDNHQVVSVFSNQNDAYKAGVGFVLDFDDEYFVLASISEGGMYDGYALKQCRDIFRIDCNCEYEQKYDTLYKLKKQTHKAFTKMTDNMLADFLYFTLEQKFVIGIGIRDYSISVRGNVENIDLDNRMISISEITDNGDETGIITFDFSSVYRVNCDEEENQNIKLLNLARNI